MSMTGLDDVVRNFNNLMRKIELEKTEKAITVMLISGGARALAITPIDTGLLVQSQGKKVWRTPMGMSGAVYYGADYADEVHQASGRGRGLPRPSGNGNYWDPEGEPRFLTKGMEQMAATVNNILENIYKV